LILKPFQEIVGTLTEIEVKDGCIMLVFAIEREIEIPTAAISHDRLDQIKGQRIGLFNNSEKYFIRKINEKEMKEYEKEKINK